MAEGSHETNLDVFLNEDSDNDIETSPDIIGEEEYNVLFDSEDDESDFEGFQESLSPIKNRNGNNIGNNNNNDAVNNVENNDEPAVSKKKNPDADAPAGFKMAKWKKGDTENMAELPFTGKPGFNVDIPEDANELFFLTLFLSEEIIDSLTLETNMYGFDFLTANEGKLGSHSRFLKWPEQGIKVEKMLAFIALMYYMGVVKKDLIQHYWSIDATLSTPFPRTVMSRNEFENIFSFLHCCNNQDYLME